MSRINDLIQELCPDGVRFMPLGLLGVRNHGTSMTANKMKELANHPGHLRIFAAGETKVDVAENCVTDKDIVREPSIIVKSRGHIGFTYYDKPFTHKSELWSYTIKNPQVNQKFIYYFLLTKVTYFQHLAEATSVKLPQLSIKDTDKLDVPIPPMEVQEEIVRILDSLTSLEAELEAELEARQEQYCYYRNDIISKCTSSCIRMPLSDIGMLIRGHGMTKSDFTDKGIGAIHYGQLYTTFDTATDSVMSYVSPAIAQSLLTVNPGNLIISNTSENLDDVGKAVAWLGDNQIVTGGHATVLRHNQNPKYLAYWFQTPDFQLQKRKYAAGTKVIELPAKALEKIVIPLPSLSDQSRIVSELDKFRLLNVSMSSGLPAEIETRHKQYEYYRDRLLTFKEQDHE